MCGIIAYSSNNPTPKHLQIIEKLFIESKVRGTHAFGVYYLIDSVNRRVNRHCKEYSITKLLKEFDSIRQMSSMVSIKLIGHTRYSTSGDWLNHNNNQPIISSDNNGLVFNGVIDMRTKLEWEKEYKIKFNTENDGEILLRLGLDNPVNFITQRKCTFAGAILTRDGKLIVMRNKMRPAWILEHLGATFVASTKDIFIRALGKNITPQELPINQLIYI